MVHYIRFLRTPQVECDKKSCNISAVIAVTTDLGDSFFAEDVELNVELTEANGLHGLIHGEKHVWQGASRALKFVVRCPAKYASRSVRMHVTTKATASAMSVGSVPRILDVWSTTFPLTDKQRTEPVVERQLLLPNNTRLRMWEETGDSIARHIW
jgi:hypothetical protein